MLDFCVRFNTTESRCFSSGIWHDNEENIQWEVPWQTDLPLQLGGVAHEMNSAEFHGWKNQPLGTFFKGCISRLDINHEVINW